MFINKVFYVLTIKQYVIVYFILYIIMKGMKISLYTCTICICLEPYHLKLQYTTMVIIYVIMMKLITRLKLLKLVIICIVTYT